MGIQINGQTDTVTSTTSGGRVTVTPVNFPSVTNINVSGISTFTGGLSVGAGGTVLTTSSDGRVAIGTATLSTSSPSSLVVNGAIESLRDSAGEGGQIILRAQSGGAYRWNIDNNSASSVFRIFREDDGSAANGLEMLKIDSSGRVTMPYQPAFFAYPNTATSLGANITLVLPNTQFNIGSNYSTSTGRFTAPVSGVYHFSYGVQHNASVSDNILVDLYLNGTHYSSSVRAELFTSSTYHMVTASATIYMNASDYATIFMGGTGWGDDAWFSGHLVG